MAGGGLRRIRGANDAMRIGELPVGGTRELMGAVDAGWRWCDGVTERGGRDLAATAAERRRYDLRAARRAARSFLRFDVSRGRPGAFRRLAPRAGRRVHGIRLRALDRSSCG